MSLLSVFVVLACLALIVPSTLTNAECTCDSNPGFIRVSESFCFMSVTDGPLSIALNWAFPDFDFAVTPVRDINGNPLFKFVEQTMFGEPGYIPSTPGKVGGFLVLSDGNTILFDTGLGEVDPFVDLKSDTTLYQQLQDLGCADVDIVVTSHLHFDHVGWNVRYSDDSDPDSPQRAIQPTWEHPTVYYVQNDEYYHWKKFKVSNNDSVLIQTKKGMLTHIDTLVESGQIALRFGDYFVTSKVQVRRCIGHTFGHQCMYLYDDEMNARVLLAGDAFHTTYQVSDPDLSPMFDLDRQKAVDTRKLLVGEAFQNDILLAPAHYPGIGRVVQCGDEICHAVNGLTWVQMDKAELEQWSRIVMGEDKNDL